MSVVDHGPIIDGCATFIPTLIVLSRLGTKEEFATNLFLDSKCSVGPSFDT